LALRIQQESAWTEIDVIIDKKSHLEIVLWVRTSHLDLVIEDLRLLFQLQ
jgi:hypothetical protein